MPESQNVPGFIREFGARVASRRRQLGMSQAQLADRIGVGQDTMSKLESGQAAPKFRRLNAIAEALHCTIAELFMGGNLSEKEKAVVIAEIIHSLPPLWQDCLLSMVQQMATTIKNTYDVQKAPDDGDQDTSLS